MLHDALFLLRSPAIPVFREGPGEGPGATVVLLTLFAILNLGTFAVWGWDKLCAVKGWRRVPEIWLLGLSACFGYLGAWIGCSAFRHKTKKTSFRWRLVVATLLGAAASYWVAVTFLVK